MPAAAAAAGDAAADGDAASAGDAGRPTAVDLAVAGGLLALPLVRVPQLLYAVSVAVLCYHHMEWMPVFALSLVPGLILVTVKHDPMRGGFAQHVECAARGLDVTLYCLLAALAFVAFVPAARALFRLGIAEYFAALPRALPFVALAVVKVLAESRVEVAAAEMYEATVGYYREGLDMALEFWALVRAWTVARKPDRDTRLHKAPAAAVAAP